MKAHLLSAILLLTGATVAAQQGLYLKAEGGWGGTRSHQRSYVLPGHSSVSLAAPAYRGALVIGTTQGRLSFEAGIGFGRTGSRNVHEMSLFFEMDFDSAGNTILSPAPTSFTFTLLHTHFTVPFSVGYAFPITDRLAFQPRLGVEGAYNAWANQSVESAQTGRRNTKITGEAYHKFHDRFTLFGTAAVQMHYKTGERTSVFAGASYRHALTNMLDLPANLPIPGWMRTSAYTADAGVLFFLKRAPRQAPAAEAAPGEG